MNWQAISFSSRPYEIWEESLDLYGDGSVVLVPVAGHSPGSMAMFVNISNNERYLFCGDLVWGSEGLTHPAEKFLVSRWLVDHNSAEVRQQIVKISRLIKTKTPEQAMPAHDWRALENFARL